MNKIEVKKLFWGLVNNIYDCSDTTVENKEGVIVERGMTLSNNYYVLFGLDDGVVRLYNPKQEIVEEFTEDSETLLILKELFETLKM